MRAGRVRRRGGAIAVAVAAFLTGAGVSAAGRAVAAGPQAAGPVPGYATHVTATHFLRDRRYETHHYFKAVREGVLQGLVFRETAEGAPLVEVEWAISPEVYASLPEWQKGHWHPLFPAVDGARVRLPDLPPEEERAMLGTIRGLYAQTLNLAGVDGELPVGPEGVRMVTHLTAEEMRALLGGGAGVR